MIMIYRTGETDGYSAALINMFRPRSDHPELTARPDETVFARTGFAGSRF